MSKTAITSPELTPPVGPFSKAIEVVLSSSSADRNFDLIARSGHSDSGTQHNLKGKRREESAPQ